MRDKILLLGSTGKMGVALQDIFKNDYAIVGKSSADFDALNLVQAKNLIEENKPDIVINTIAFLGIDSCEKEPEKAFRLNTLFPKLLAELSHEKEFVLVHFSTDAVFNDKKKDFYTEEDCPCPLNVYGFTKYGGDCFIQAIAKKYYILRIPVLFGETIKNTQFVEKMLQKIHEGQKVLKISGDIISSPTYSRDVAREVWRIMYASYQFGLYHIANEGKASLYDLMKEITENLNLDVEVEEASYKEFPFLGIKNTFTPIRSEKVSPLRHWKEAVKGYCNNIEEGVHSSDRL